MREVAKTAREPVDLVDDHDVDQVALHIAQQPGQCGPTERGAGEPRVLVNGGTGPAGCELACDVSLASFALGIDRVELHAQALVGGDAAVDGASPSTQSPGATNLAVNRIRFKSHEDAP